MEPAAGQRVEILVDAWFNARAACTSGSPFDLEVTLPENLQPGMNVLTIGVGAEERAAAEARRKSVG